MTNQRLSYGLQTTRLAIDNGTSDNFDMQKILASISQCEIYGDRMTLENSKRQSTYF
jgi:hypothetical protein